MLTKKFVNKQYEYDRQNGNLPSRSYYNNIGGAFEYIVEDNDGWKTLENDTRNGRRRKKRRELDNKVKSIMENLYITKYNAWKLLKFNGWNMDYTLDSYNSHCHTGGNIDSLLASYIESK
jgi:hypothetical protein